MCAFFILAVGIRSLFYYYFYARSMLGFGEFVGLVDVFRVLISYLGLAVFPDCAVMVLGVV